MDSPQELPPRLCRYRSFTAGKELGVYDLLRGRLRFADVRTFNDPFEARPLLVAAYKDAAEQRNAVIRYFATRPPGSLQDDPVGWAEGFIGERSMEQLVDALANLDRSNRYFALCLMTEETVKQCLSWAHYADEHRGVCIHFDTSKRPLSLADRVIYGDEYPEIVFPRTERPIAELVKNLVFRKSSCWKHEEEYRVVRLRNGPSISGNLGVYWSTDGVTALAPLDIAQAVTIGYRMDPELRARLLSWIKVNRPHVEVWQASLSRTSYEVVRERVS